MPTINLTQRAVDALKPPATGRAEYFDRTLPGFGLRISDSGRKTWIVMYRVGTTKVRETIGTVAAIPNVADARKRARESIELVQRGAHPVEARKATAAAELSFAALQTNTSPSMSSGTPGPRRSAKRGALSSGT